MRNETISEQADRLGAKFITAAKVRELRRKLRVVAAAPFEPSLEQDTILYQNTETGEYFKLTRARMVELAKLPNKATEMFDRDFRFLDIDADFQLEDAQISISEYIDGRAG